MRGHQGFILTTLLVLSLGSSWANLPSEKPISYGGMVSQTMEATVQGQINEATPTSLAEKSSPATYEEKPIPLAKISAEHAQEVAGEDPIPRLLTSLSVVLLLAVAFLRYGLPKLAERYPGAFQPLQSRSGKQTGVASYPFMKSSKEGFKLLHTFQLGGGKQLHLVKIKDHELVVATTPNDVKFLTALSNPSSKWSDAAKAEHFTET